MTVIRKYLSKKDIFVTVKPSDLDELKAGLLLLGAEIDDEGDYAFDDEDNGFFNFVLFEYHGPDGLPFKYEVNGSVLRQWLKHIQEK